MNIIKLKGDNNGGLKHLLVFDASRVVSTGKPVGHYVYDGICFFSDSKATYIEGTYYTVSFTEVPVIIEGVPMYQQTVSCIIPKDRPEIIDMFQGWDMKRFIVLAPDQNGYTKMLGTIDQPCSYQLGRSTKAGHEEHNDMELSFTITRKHRAYNYVPPTIAVQTVGVITIGNRVHIA